MNKLSKIIKESPFWLITILISIVSLIFIYLQAQVNLFPENEVKKLYYIDNISEAHLIIINKFNEKYKDQIEVLPVNLPFQNFTTNDRKQILTRSLRSYRSDLIQSLLNGEEIEKKIQNSLTWDEFISLGKNFHNSQNPYYIFPGGELEGMICCFHEMLSVDESKEIFSNTSVDLNTPSAKRSLQLLTDFIHKLFTISAFIFLVIFLSYTNLYFPNFYEITTITVLKIYRQHSLLI